jgi:hypothetical protein
MYIQKMVHTCKERCLHKQKNWTIIQNYKFWPMMFKDNA